MSSEELCETNHEQDKFFRLLLIGLLIRILFAAVFQGFISDLEYFRQWALMAAKSNLVNFYRDMQSQQQFVNYPPFYIYFLFLIGKLFNLFGLTTLNWLSRLLLKLPAVIADVMTAYLLYQLARKYLSARVSYILAAFYLFNPVVWYDSAVWGQVDSVLTLLMVAGLLLIANGKTNFATIPFTVAVLMKPQGLFVFPVLFFELLQRKKFSNFLIAVFYGAATTLAVALPFSTGFDLSWLVKLYFNTANDFQYASVNAYNFFTLVGANFVNDSKPFLFLTFKIWGYIFFAAVILFVTFLYYKSYKNKNNEALFFLAGLVMVFGAFTVLIRMHERYMFPAPVMVLMAFCYYQDKRLLRIFGGVSFTGLLNMCFVPYPVNLFVSLANLLLLGYICKVSLDIVKGRIDKFGANDTIAREVLKFGMGKLREFIKIKTSQ